MLGSSDLINLRYYGTVCNAIGELIRINFISGDIIEGLLFSIDPIFHEFFIITHPRRMSRSNKPWFLKEIYWKIFYKEILFVQCQYKNLHPLAKGSFETDVDISNKKKPSVQHKLVQYKLKEGEELYTGNLNEDMNEKWDQFQWNKQKYNVSSSYNENDYTTSLDKTAIPKEQKLKADKIFQEIMANSNKNDTNIHVLEDRGLEWEDENMDEEDKYSSVLRGKK